MKNDKIFTLKNADTTFTLDFVLRSIGELIYDRVAKKSDRIY